MDELIGSRTLNSEVKVTQEIEERGAVNTDVVVHFGLGLGAEAEWGG